MFQDRAIHTMRTASSNISTASSIALFESASLYAATRGAVCRTSAGNTASAPYTIKNGVYSVDLLGVVRKLYSTDGSSSTHAPAARLSGVINLLLSLAVISPFDRSTWPLV